MSDKKRYHVPLIVEVTCDDLDEARRIAYKFVTTKGASTVEDDEGNPVSVGLTIADDEFKDGDNNRIVFLHPADTHAGYNVEEYEKALEEKTKILAP